MYCLLYTSKAIDLPRVFMVAIPYNTEKMVDITDVIIGRKDVYKRQDYDFAHLLFSDGTVENAISLDNQLNIIQVADLVLPDKDLSLIHI